MCTLKMLELLNTTASIEDAVKGVARDKETPPMDPDVLQKKLTPANMAELLADCVNRPQSSSKPEW